MKLQFTFLLILLTSCGKEFTSSPIENQDASIHNAKITFNPLISFFESGEIIGNNPLISVNTDVSNIDADLKNLANSVGLMSTGCTATHIGNKIAITAGHCLEDNVGMAPTLRRNLPCSNVSIFWPSNLKTTCVQVLALEESATADYAIFSVNAAPVAAMAIQNFAPAADGSKITIMSYPLGQPLAWSQYCSLHKMTDPSETQMQFYHDCSTQPGSSGAAVVEVNANTTPAIVGIHDGYINPMNYGTYMSAIPNEVWASIQIME